MADGAPPNKRPKTDGDLSSILEGQLPDDLISSSSSMMPSNNGFGLPTSQTSSQSSQGSSSVLSPHPVPTNAALPASGIQSRKQLTKLLQSHNSPKHAQTSPSSSFTNSPRPPQPTHPHPSPLSTGQNSMQSPTAGQMAAVMNSMKSPQTALPRPNSRPSSAINATPSPRPVSLPGGTMNITPISNSPIAISMTNQMRNNSMVFSQPSVNSHGMVLSGSNQDKLIVTNGGGRPIQGMQNVGNDFSNDLGMGQMNATGQMMNQPQGNYIPQPRMQQQIGPMHSMSSSMNTFGQNVTNMSGGPRQMQVNPAAFNDTSIPRPPSNMNMTQDGNIMQNRLNDGVSVNMDGSMMIGDKNDTMQMMQTQRVNNIGIQNMQRMQNAKRLTPNMQPHPTSQVQDINVNMSLPDTNQVHMQPQSLPNIQQNHIGVGQIQQHTGGPDQMGQMQVKNPNATGASATSADPEKRRLIQQQLVLLLHAYKCAKKEHSGDATNCALPHCRTMKEVLRHMNVCNQGKSCQVAHCASSRQIIAHWRACDRNDCVICLPLKSVPNTNNPTNVGGPTVPNQLQQPRWQNPVSQIGESSVSTATGLPGAGTSSGPPYTGNFNDPTLHLNNSNVPDPFAGLPNGLAPNQVGPMSRVNFGENLFHAPRVDREWHKDVKEELRNHLVQKLVQAIFPSPQKVSLTDERMKKLVHFARKVEGDMYEQANNRSEYYHLLAEKIYKIQKELEEKRAMRMRRPGGPRMNMAPNGPMAVQNQGMQMQRDPAMGMMQTGGVRMPGVGGMNGPQHGMPGGVRFGPPGTNVSSAQGKVLENMLVGAPMSHNHTNDEYPMNPMIKQFQQAKDEIRLQLDDASPVTHVDGRNSGINTNIQPFNQNNALQDSSTMNNNMTDNLDGFPQPQQDIKPNMGSQNSVDGMLGVQRSTGMQDPMSRTQSNFNNQKPVSSRPRLEKLLRETAPSSIMDSVSATSGFLPMSNNNSYINSDPSKNQISQHQKVFPNESDQSQHPASLKEILEGGSSTNTITSDASSVGSFVSPSNASAAPFVSKPQPIGSKDTPSNNNSSLVPSNGFNVSNIKSEMGGKGGKPIGMEASDSTPLVKTEPQDQGFGSTGKPGWSPSVSSNTEVKMEPSDHFAATPSPAPTQSSSNHDPFVKQESVSSSGEPRKVSRKVFEPQELKVGLLPIVEKLYKQEPEALPFRQPVDPEKLNIPDYFDIVTEPMDLASIRKNLETGKYKEPWEFISDIWLMFNNAWLYNRRTTRVYKYCSKLKEIFEAEIDPVMQSLGYCCGRKLEFMPMTLCCYGKQLCTIPTGAVYYDYQNRYDYCEKCFNDINGDVISLADDPSKPQSSMTTIPKSQFEKKKNDVLDSEPFEICQECGRKMHKICVLHMSPIWPEGFTCDDCLSKRGAQRKPNRYVGVKLPQNKLGEHIERRVNNYIKRNDSTGEAGHVHIRVVYSGDKTVEVRSGMKTKFVDTKEMPETFPYRAKAFFAFEEIDGVDVCFFGVHVQEYGSDAPKPNQRRVYLSYLDSVHFFRPRHLRTAVYHEILIGYFEYCKNLGYEFAHIWACPPCEGDDYIFHCHPQEQKIPKPKRLQDWYKKMLDKAISEQVIIDYKDIFHQAKEDRLQSARELPYFEGDFWPNVLEESIKEIEQEEEDRKQAEASEQAAAEEALLFKFSPLQSQSDSGGNNNSKNGKNKKSKKANIKKTSQRTTKKKLPQVMNDLSDKLYQIMEKHKEVFFVIRLQSVEMISKMGPTVDPDPTMQCDLMDGRDAFLTLAREKHYEFSSLRRAKWSTMAMLIELHTQGQDKFSYMCNRCRNNVETRYQCRVCHDFDLCVNCYNQIGHEHKMDKMGFGLDDGTGSPGAGSGNTKSSTIPVERCMQSLVHACQCKNANCNMPACYKMKKVVHHAKTCKKKTKGTCPICKQLIALCCYHAKHCKEKKCPVAFCHNIKNKLKQQEVQHRMQQAYLMKRRMEMMSRSSAPQSGPSTPATNSSLQQASPKIHSISDSHMRKPQPSPMKGAASHNQQDTTQQMQVASRPLSAHGMMPQTPEGAMIGGGMNPQARSMTSPHMNANPQQYNSPGVGISQQQQQPVPQAGILSPGQSLQQVNFGRKYPSPPPMGAVRAAKQAQQVADQQARDRERYSPMVYTSVSNQSQIGNRPPNPMSINRPVMGGNTGPGGWPNQMQTRPQVRQQNMPGQLQMIIGDSPPVSTINQSLRQVLHILKNDNMPGPSGARGPKPRSSEQLKALLKTNPQLMSSLIRERKQQAQNKQQQATQQQKQFITQVQGNMPTSMGNVQQQTMQGGVQQVTLQAAMNQPGISMQPVQVTNSNMQHQIHWQQQRRMQLQQQQQQNQFQAPAPPYQPTRMMNNPIVRFQQHRIPGQIRHQMNPGMVMQQGMNSSMPNMQQGLQSSLQHQMGMSVSNTMPSSRPPSQPMPTGRVGLPQMSPHPMAGRTTPLNQNAQVSGQQHMVSTMEQQYNNTINSQPGMMGGGGFSHQVVSQSMNFNTGAGNPGTGFTTNVNPDMGHMQNAAPGQDNLERFVNKIGDK
ncbi:CREB-binding protein-like isoform X2 [Styela clava]